MINKINNTQYTIPKQQNKNTSFKSLSDLGLNGLNFLATNQGLGACAVDLSSMVIPRTIIDFKKRGSQAGIETGIREGSSCLIHASIGLIGTAIGALVSNKINKKFNIKAHNIYANGETIDYCADLWKKSGSKKEYFSKILDSMQGLDGEVWKKIPKEVSETVADSLANAGTDKSAIAKAVAQITKATGAQANFKIENGGKILQNSAETILEHAKSLSQAFEKVDISNTGLFNSFVSKLKKTKLITTIAGIGFCAALCMSIQPLNKFFTKMRTGQDGFVGVEGAGADNSKEFKIKKTAVGLGLLAAMHSSIGKPRNLLQNIQFNGKAPTINQFKFIYGLTIASRIFSARDNNELREGFIKDSLGFTNWLILGGMVSKLSARAMGKDLINNPVVAKNGKKGLKYAAEWITKASVKNYSEILMPGAKELTRNGKLLNTAQLYKAADKATKSKVLKVAGSQILGYLYSGIVLGIGIAKLNIFITNRIKNKEREQSLSNNPIIVRVSDNTVKNQALAFSMSNKISK